VVIPLVAAAVGWVARQPTHEQPIRCLFLSAEGSEVLSLDAGGTVKRWDAGNGRYRGSLRNRALSGASRIVLGPDGWLLAFDPPGAALYAGLEERRPVIRLPHVQQAVFTPEDELVAATPRGLVWRDLSDPENETRVFPWPWSVLGVAVTPAGETWFLDQAGHLARLAPSLAAVRERIDVGPRYRSVVSTPSGQRLLLVGLAGDAATVGPGDSAPRPLREVGLARFAFAGADTIVFDRRGLKTASLGDGEVRDLMSLPPRTEVDSVAASAEHGRVFYAQGPHLYLVRAADATRPADSVHLRRFRF
jgi:hypothetical protein